MPTCCVVGCVSRQDESGVRLYNFPWRKYEEELRERWIRAINRLQPDGSLWRPTKHSRVCSKHFSNGEKSSIWNHPSSVPSIFPAVVYQNKTNEQMETRKSARYDRAKKRRRSIPSASLTGTQDPLVEEDILVPFDFEERTREAEVQVFIPQTSRDNHQMCTFDIARVSDCEIAVQCDIPQIWQIKAPQMKDAACGIDETLLRTKGFIGFSSIRSDEQMKSFTGVNFDIFNLLLGMIDTTLSIAVSNETALLMCLTKLKLNMSYIALSTIFQLHRVTTAKIFQTTLCYMSSRTADFIFWPSKESVSSCLPGSFRRHYPNARVIIDCTETRCEQPKLVAHRIPMYSDYKGGHTIKFMVGITPNGFICFKSKAYGGRTSDTYIVNDCDFLSKLEPNDVVLADKGFPGIKCNDNVIVVLHPFVKNGHLTEEKGLLTETIASVRIHVERCIRRIKYFGILSHIRQPIFPYIDDIIHLCCVIANFMGPIIKE